MFRQASEFTGFHKKLGVLIEPYLNERWTMADIGCGMALLDFQLMNNVRSIKAIDIDRSALDEVERRIDEELSANHNDARKIETLQKDAYELTNERWDVVLMSFFADSPEMVDRMLSRADHRGIIVMHGHERGGIFDPRRSDSPRMTVLEMEDYLMSKGYGYRKSVVDLQFGQPFRAIGEIHEFLGDKVGSGREADIIEGIGNDIPGEYDELAAPDESAAAGGPGASGVGVFDIDNFAYSAEERIIKTKRYDYPYYLPRNLHTALFIVMTRR
ncbi:MAG: hypothetical protein LBS67_00920 [Clostridiales Family XIII bacterium]|nr:hypothetical protein [Clostridiales Family XIII bacterium]